jgi:hypothetical protein
VADETPPPPVDGPRTAAVRAALAGDITVDTAMERITEADRAMPGPPERKVTQAERNLEVVARQDARLHRRVSTTMEHMLAAADLNDDGTPVDPDMGTEVDGRPKGWSHRKWRVARDGRISSREQPGYLATATRMHASYASKDSGKPPPVALNVDVQVAIVSPAAQAVVGARYRVIDVTDDGADRK